MKLSHRICWDMASVPHQTREKATVSAVCSSMPLLFLTITWPKTNPDVASLSATPSGKLVPINGDSFLILYFVDAAWQLRYINVVRSGSLSWF